MTAEIYLAAGKLMAERGLLYGVPTKALLARVSTNEEALEMLIRAIDETKLIPTIKSPSRSTSLPANSVNRGATKSAWKKRARFDDLIACWAVAEQYPIVSIEDPLAEGR